MKEVVCLVSLGCPKNLVDSEVILGLLSKEGYPLTTDPLKAEVLIVNTCSFIEEATKEAMIQRAAKSVTRRTAKIRRLRRAMRGAASSQRSKPKRRWASAAPAPLERSMVKRQTVRL